MTLAGAKGEIDTECRVTQISLRFDQLKTELPKPDNPTASVYISLGTDTEVTEASDTPMTVYRKVS